MNNKTIKKVATIAIAATSLISFVGMAQAATLTSQLGVGSRGTNVTNLQQFLASNHDIYPDGRVTGYYGSLTRAAVMQFQLSYGIPMVGNVGPATLAKINNVMNSGYGIDVYAPSIYSASVQKNTNSATFTWATTENAAGKVYYSTSPFSMSEAIGNFSAPSIMGGSVMFSNNLQTNQSITVSNLLANTTYYYILQATDASGNVSVTNTATFITN